MAGKIQILILLLFWALVPATEAVEVYWTCDLQAELNGVPSSFLYHNKDSWEGSGVVRCSRNNEFLEEDVQMKYEGWASATGLAGRSRLTFFSYFIPAGHPSEILKVFSTASIGADAFYYDREVTTILQVGRNRYFEVAVEASQEDAGLRVPLNYGTLSISKKSANNLSFD